MQLNYNHLHYFHVAAVEGSVGMAAQLLGVTQPTISEQLRTLERTLGVVLFERQSSGLKLTDAGRLTFKHTSVMFGAGDRLAEELDHEKREEADVLRIGVSSSIARESMPDLLTPLLGIEKCVPSIRVADYVELARELRGARLDVVLSDFEPPKSERRGFEVRLIERTTVAAVAHPSVKPSKDWHDVTLLHYRVGAKLRGEVDAFLKSRGLTPRIGAEVDDAWFLLNAVTNGNHVAFVPKPLVVEALASNRMTLLDTFQSQQTGVYALYQNGASVPCNAVDRLVEHVRTRDGQNPNG
ncbi:MAG TPA: LysR family transcriptional regulator [Kofleriaceae bacterium]|nr:LysR family transcriptional regulator [Kofleriaceae bacterium]